MRHPIANQGLVHVKWKETRPVGAGLGNYGNTCYINSVLQVFFNSFFYFCYVMINICTNTSSHTVIPFKNKTLIADLLPTQFVVPYLYACASKFVPRYVSIFISLFYFFLFHVRFVIYIFFRNRKCICLSIFPMETDLSSAPLIVVVMAVQE